MFSFSLKSLYQSAAPRFMRLLHTTSTYKLETLQMPQEKPSSQIVVSNPRPEPSPSECPRQIGKRQPRVLIVGAGVAGLSAAKRLDQIGLKNFTVLEATDRPGGRIDSRCFGDVTADLGAPWSDDLDVIDPADMTSDTKDDDALKVGDVLESGDVATVKTATVVVPSAEIKPKIITVANDCIPTGYIGGVTPLLRSLPKSSVLYNKAVVKINWDFEKQDGRRALVRCQDGEELTADFVIVTVSLGYLKTHAEQLFEPALSETKKTAIQDLGFDVVDKIFIEFPIPFKQWHKTEQLCYYWDNDEMAGEKDWAKGIRVIEKCDNSQYVLHILVAGPEATIMEKATDSEVTNVVTRVLSKISGNTNIPKPKKVLRSKWSTSGYFLGAHSFLDAQSKMIHQIHLADSLPGHNQVDPPVLLFGGEATSPGHFGSARGARISGIREAERVGHLTRKREEMDKQEKRDVMVIGGDKK